MMLVHVTAHSCGAIGVPFNAAVSAEVACAALIVAGGGLPSGARQNQSNQGTDSLSSPSAEPQSGRRVKHAGLE
jgi:hypothetical protein